MPTPIGDAPATGSAIQEKIGAAVRALIGKTLWRWTRAADMACFDFGQRRLRLDRHGKEREIGEYALHVECAWRMIEGDRVVVGRQDLYYPAEYDEGAPYPDNFDWEHDPNRHDKLLDILFKNCTREFLVAGVEVGAAGSFRLLLADKFSLEVIPTNSLVGEQWRLFEPGREKQHFVVSGKDLGA
ncbi:MAG: hypothetical protein LAO19_09770 [Acidobacteriia bacterium]|nr:hypothetical protein [Terriglobia bacterium]